MLAVEIVAEVSVNFAVVLSINLHRYPQPIISKPQFWTKNIKASAIHSERMNVGVIEVLEEFKASVEEHLDILLHCRNISSNFLGVVSKLLQTANKLLCIRFDHSSGLLLRLAAFFLILARFFVVLEVIVVFLFVGIVVEGKVVLVEVKVVVVFLIRILNQLFIISKLTVSQINFEITEFTVYQWEFLWLLARFMKIEFGIDIQLDRVKEDVMGLAVGCIFVFYEKGACKFVEVFFTTNSSLQRNWPMKHGHFHLR